MSAATGNRMFAEEPCPTLVEQTALEDRVLRFYEQLAAVPPTQRRQHLTLQVCKGLGWLRDRLVASMHALFTGNQSHHVCAIIGTRMNMTTFQSQNQNLTLQLPVASPWMQLRAVTWRHESYICRHVSPALLAESSANSATDSRTAKRSASSAAENSANTTTESSAA